jgi:hypothetical protein
MVEEPLDQNIGARLRLAPTDIVLDAMIEHSVRGCGIAWNQGIRALWVGAGLPVRIAPNE